jgi:hypothetical protein
VNWLLLRSAGADDRRDRLRSWCRRSPPLATADLRVGAVRLLVYALREIFGTPAWLPSSERVISFTIWGIVALHFTGARVWAELTR